MYCHFMVYGLILEHRGDSHPARFEPKRQLYRMELVNHNLVDLTHAPWRWL
jgi:hypothetical protein